MSKKLSRTEFLKLITKLSKEHKSDKTQYLDGTVVDFKAQGIDIFDEAVQFARTGVMTDTIRVMLKCQLGKETAMYNNMAHAVAYLAFLSMTGVSLTLYETAYELLLESGKKAEEACFWAWVICIHKGMQNLLNTKRLEITKKIPYGVWSSESLSQTAK